MAAFDVFEILVHGRGSHAAKPQLSVDPIVVASHLVTALQTIVSRNIDPLEQAVVSVTEHLLGTLGMSSLNPRSFAARLVVFI